MVGLQTLDLAIGVRVPASQPKRITKFKGGSVQSRPFCVPQCVAGFFGKFLSVFRSSDETEADMNAAEFTKTGIPSKRYDGLLVPSPDGLGWHPRTAW